MTAAPDLFGTAAPPAPAPISAGSPAIIRAAVERERRDLARLGRFGAEAERQAHDGRCQACGEPLDDTRPVVAVITAKSRSPVWLHGGACHDQHARRHAARIDALMSAAGFALAPVASPSSTKDCPL